MYCYNENLEKYISRNKIDDLKNSRIFDKLANPNNLLILKNETGIYEDICYANYLGLTHDFNESISNIYPKLQFNDNDLDVVKNKANKIKPSKVVVLYNIAGDVMNPGVKLDNDLALSTSSDAVYDSEQNIIDNVNAYTENYDFIKFALTNFINDYSNETKDIKEIFDKQLYSLSDKNMDLLKKVSFRFSLFRMIPSFMRKTFYDNSNWYIYGKNDSVNINTSLSELSILNSLQYITSITNSGNYFNFIHNNTTHEQFYFNDNFLPSIWKKNIPQEDMKKFKSEFSSRKYYSHGAFVNNIIRFFKFLKENNLYDNTKIIIVSDHGTNMETDFYQNNGLEFMSIYNAFLMYKDFNSTNDFTISSNFMTVADVPYLSTKHLSKQINPFTHNIITNDYKNGELKVIILNEWQPNRQLEKGFNFSQYYTVKGSIFDKNNWTLNTLQK